MAGGFELGCHRVGRFLHCLYHVLRVKLEGHLRIVDVVGEGPVEGEAVQAWVVLELEDGRIHGVRVPDGCVREDCKWQVLG